MAGNGENQYDAASGDANAGGSSWGSAPPVMHSWCLQPDGPPAASVQSESRSRLMSDADADADDDCGFDLNLGLSLGGGGKSSKTKGGREKEKELALDRDVFREKHTFRSEHGARRDGLNGEEALHGGVMFKPLKTEQGGGNPNASANRVQSFWQDLDRSGNEAKEKTSAAFPPRQVQSLISNQQNEHSQQAAAAVEPSNWAGVNSVAEDSKMFAQHMWQALQGKAAQPEHQRVPLSARDEASLIKELQGLPPQAVATAAAWARVVAQGGFPVQLLEAIKDGVDPVMAQGMALQRSMSMKSHSDAIPLASPAMSQQTAAPSGDLERSDSDVSKNMSMEQQQQRQVAMIQQQELVEQQRKRELQTQKRQEARRKRKALLEGQKSKKSKKEDEKPGGSKSGSLDSPPNSLRRTSSLQQPTAAVSKENSLSTVSSPPDSQDAGGASSASVFRRPGSSSWLHNWEGSPQMASGAAKAESEKTQHGTDGRVESVEQMAEIRRALERARDKTVEGVVQQQVDSSSESRKNESPDVVQMQRMDLESSAGAAGRQGGMSRQEGSGLGSLPPGMVNGQIDPAWIQKIMEMQMSSHQLSAMMENSKEMAGKSGFPPTQKRGEKAHPAPKQEVAKRGGRGASESSSGGTESSGGQDEKSNSGGRIVYGDAEALSSPAAAAAAAGNSMNAAGDGRSNAGNSAIPSLANAAPMGNMTFSPGTGFPMMPSPFPFPLPMPPGGAAGGVPFSMPFPFPYLMQFAPNPGAPGDGNPEQRGNSGMASPFQIAVPAGFNPSFQIQTPEGAAAWAASAAAVQPHATPPQSPSRHTASKTGPSGLSREDEKHGGGRGMKGNDHARSRNAPGGGEPSAQALVKANSLGSGAFNRLRSTGAPATTSPLAPQFGISRSKSDAVSLRREGSAGSAFAALVEPFPAPSHGQQANSGVHGGAKASSAGNSTPRPEPGTAHEAPAPSEEGGSLAAAAASTHPGGSGAEAAAAQSTSAAEENMRRGQQQPTGLWQGSVPSFEGLGGHEASSLRPGVAPGMQFGGTGQTPDLPWVTCNGTISGVLYRVEKGQVRIVCACHGRHMTPGEFVQHAGCGEIPNPEKAIVVGPFTVLSQQPASAQA